MVDAAMHPVYHLRMKKTEAIKRAGSQSALARLLGISPQAVCKWPDEVPQLQAYRLKEKKPSWFRKARK